MTPIYIIACIDTGELLHHDPRIVPILTDNQQLKVFSSLKEAKGFKQEFELECDVECLIFKCNVPKRILRQLDI
jgi:hypothetical protein